MSFDVPREVVLPVDRVEVRLNPAPHPFALAHAAQIAANWRAETAANPALFNGEMVLLSSLAYHGRQLTGRCHMVRYAAFLYWRKHRDASAAAHAFAHAALVTADNALLAIRMGRHTVNPGAVYFAAGSFEPVDFPAGVADLHGNMAREVLEETGLNIGDAPRDPAYHAFSQAAGTVIFRRYRLGIEADAAAERVADFVAAEAEPEISGPVVIRSADDLPVGILPHMEAIVRWHFGPGATEGPE
jgi:8-oxo-dGTP pyrophosphatase MutT (NUDIX family)